ncbi:MAG: hypothetical protein ABL951_00470 [Alphaproteobacteria bacterium]
MAIIDDISALYAAYFNRAPDPAGLNFWIGRASGVGGPAMGLVEIANSFAEQPEARNLYSFLSAPLVGSPVSFLSSVYLNLFGRAATPVTDAEGFAYWTAQLANPAIGVGRVILDIRSGATGNDLLVINNKTAVGTAFAQTLIETAAVFKLPLAQSAFAGVTQDAASVTAAMTRNNVAITDVIAPAVTPFQTFSYAENRAAGDPLGTVAATDNAGGGGVSGFTIISGNSSGFFAIGATGVISLTEAGAAAATASNDFEIAPNFFTLGVSAIDFSGNVSAAAPVTMNVTNVDDTAPMFRDASASNISVRLNFDEVFRPAVISNAAFTAQDANNAIIAVNAVSINGSQIILSLAAAPVGAVRINYSPPVTGDVLQDAAGNRVAATNVTVNVASTNVLANNLTLSFNDPGGALASFELAISQSVNVAWNLWAAHFTRTAPIEIEINMMAGAPTTLASARSLVTQTSGEFFQGKRVLQVGVAFELATGIDPNGGNVDAEISLGTDISRFVFRTALSEQIPRDKFDAISVFAHEIGHILGFNASTLLSGSFVGSFERYITGATLPLFTGPNALAANGGAPVLLDSDSPSHLANAADLMSARIVAGQQKLVEPLHIAILQDVGVPITLLGAGGLV